MLLIIIKIAVSLRLCFFKERSLFKIAFGLLEKSRCPTLLMEQCFVTNSSDVALLSGEEGTMRAANAYYKAICDFFEEELSSGS